MTNFTVLYADIILKKIITKIRKDTEMKNKATERKLANASDGRSVRTMRHWSAAASSEFYYKEIAKQLDMAEDRVYRKRMELKLRRKRRYPRSKAVYQLDVNGNRLRRFDSVKAAAHFICGSPNAIAYVCRGERPLFRGFGWEYE